MSKLSDYSKFDHLDESDGDSDQEESSPSIHEAATRPMGGVTKKGSEGRYVFEYNGQKIYEWEQSLEEVNIYVDAPPGVKANQLDCQITSNRLRLGIQGRDVYFIDEETFGKVDTSESSWYLDSSDGVINIVLIKVHKGETWESALRGRAQEAANPFTTQEMQKKLMLERFQEENPGMDFRDADFNGEVPDPRTFMGGVKYR